MTTQTHSWIEFRETGNTLFAIPYGTYRKFDQTLSKNASSANGLKFTFQSFENQNIERLLKRATDACFLFRISTIEGWKKLFENEVQIEKITE